MIPTHGDHLLPSNATPLERALSASDARMLAVPHWVIRAAWNPDTCPVPLLPYLALAWSVDEWDPSWTEAHKRQVIKDSVWIHQHKGTIGALVRAIGQLGLPVTVQEWFSYRGRPYCFRLIVDLEAGIGWARSQSSQLYRTAIAAKNVRSFLEQILVRQPPATTTGLGIGVAVAVRVKTRLVVAPVTSISTPRAYAYCGAALVTQQQWRILPRT